MKLSGSEYTLITEKPGERNTSVMNSNKAGTQLNWQPPLILEKYIEEIVKLKLQ